MATTLTVAVSDGVTFSAPSTGLWVDTLTRSGRTWRRAYSSSAYHHGDTLVSATLGTEQMVAVVYAKAADSAALATMRANIEAAFSQFVFDLTVTEGDAAPVTYACDISDVAWNEYDSGMTDAHLGRATITIPCYPIPS